MLPPVLEIYVVWHPDDLTGPVIAREIFDHFHGSLFSGLAGGAVEVYVRSARWSDASSEPRPIPFPSELHSHLFGPQARFTAIVPILGLALAAQVQVGSGPWFDYLSKALTARAAYPRRVGIFPVMSSTSAVDGTQLGTLFGSTLFLGASNPLGETPGELRCRELAQGIAQMSESTPTRLQVFISHTKRLGPSENVSVPRLISDVRAIIADTRLAHFFDASDLQPGSDWDAALRDKAATSALLAVRTDLYASRDWCQREVLIAKRAGVPIVILDALGHREDRGSFLMDHVPRVPVRARTAGSWDAADIRLGLNLLVDECLKRVLWREQAIMAADDLGIAWWAPHAPEPITLLHWLLGSGANATSKELRILHPDPPLGVEEKAVLAEIGAIMTPTRSFDLMTPRALAARGG